MTIADFLHLESILLDLRARDKRQAISQIAQHLAADVTEAQPPVIEAALLAREQLGSTGLGNGFALPHARLDGLKRFHGLFVRLARPIGFDAIDGHDVRLVFALLAPNDEGAAHVAALAAVSRRLRDPNIMTSLLTCQRREEAFVLLTRT